MSSFRKSSWRASPAALTAADSGLSNMKLKRLVAVTSKTTMTKRTFMWLVSMMWLGMWLASRNMDAVVISQIWLVASMFVDKE